MIFFCAMSDSVIFLVIFCVMSTLCFFGSCRFFDVRLSNRMFILWNEFMEIGLFLVQSSSCIYCKKFVLVLWIWWEVFCVLLISRITSVSFLFFVFWMLCSVGKKEEFLL